MRNNRSILFNGAELGFLGHNIERAIYSLENSDTAEDAKKYLEDARLTYLRIVDEVEEVEELRKVHKGVS